MPNGKGEWVTESNQELELEGGNRKICGEKAHEKGREKPVKGHKESSAGMK